MSRVAPWRSLKPAGRGEVAEGASAGGSATAQEARLALVRGQLRRPLELRPRLRVAPEPLEHLAACGGQERVAGERRAHLLVAEQLQRRAGAEGHPDRDRAVQSDDRGGGDLGEAVVER